MNETYLTGPSFFSSRPMEKRVKGGVIFADEETHYRIYACPSCSSAIPDRPGPMLRPRGYFLSLAARSCNDFSRSFQALPAWSFRVSQCSRPWSLSCCNR